MKKMLMLLLTSGMFLLTGCDPDDVEFDMSTDALSAAAAGKISTATCTITFDTSMGGEDFKSNLPRIRKSILPVLGPDAKIQTKADRLVATFTAYVCPKDVAPTGKEGPYRIVVDGDRIDYVATESMQVISSRLSNINFSFDLKDNPKQVTMRISGGEASKKISAKAVFVDGSAYLDYGKKIAEGEEAEIVFSRDKNSVYSQIRPFLRIEK
jgi:type 1 fimbria pilin